MHRTVNVGVATDTERGLVVPVVKDAGALGISRIAEEITRLAEAARAGALSHEDTVGATIAVTNTGSYGSEFGTPLLNPGHAVTVALGVIAQRALVVDGTVEARLACTLSLTFDHRVLDGATVGRAFGALVDAARVAGAARGVAAMRRSGRLAGVKGQNLVTPDDVGKRVSFQFELPNGFLGEVVGMLEWYDDAAATYMVRRKDGELARVPARGVRLRQGGGADESTELPTRDRSAGASAPRTRTTAGTSSPARSSSRSSAT